MRAAGYAMPCALRRAAGCAMRRAASALAIVTGTTLANDGHTEAAPGRPERLARAHRPNQ